MIPKQLVLEGFYSYRERQVIDFERLMGAGIFGIFGPVGSGKSSIIEAISLVLFGESDRLNKQDKRSYNMMNLKSNTLLIEFFFRTEGENAAEYRFILTCRRNSKRFEDTGTLERRAYRREGEEWAPLESVNVEEIIGLNYDNFRRTMVIPQGKFLEFLELKDKERTEMLQQLFKLDRYDLFDKTRALLAREREQVTLLEGKIAQIPAEATEEKAAEIRTILEQLSETLLTMARSKKQLQEAESVFVRLADQIARLERLKQRLAELDGKADFFKEKRRRLERFENACHYFADILQRRRDLGGKKAANEERLAGMAMQRDAIEKSFAALCVTLEELRPRYEIREDVHHRLREMAVVADMLTHRQEMARVEAELAENQRHLDAAEQKKTEKSRHVTELRAALAELQRRLCTIDDLSYLQQWLSGYLALKTDLARLEREIQGLNDQSNGLRKESLALLASEPLFSEGRDQLHLFSDPDRLLADKIAAVAARCAQIDEQIAGARTTEQLAEFARQLTEGAPCPLCGSTDHPAPLHPDNVTDVLDRLVQTRREAQADEERYKALRLKLAGVNGKTEAVRESLKEKQVQHQAIVLRLEAHVAIFGFKPAPEMVDDNHVKALIEGFREGFKKKDELERQLRLAEVALDMASKERETLWQCRVAAENSRLAGQSRLKTQEEGLTAVSFKEYENRTPDEVKAQKALWESSLLRLTEAFEKADRERALKEKEAQEKEREHSLLKQTADTLAAELSQLDQMLRERLDRYGFESVEEVTDLLALGLDADREKTELREYETEWMHVRSTVAELEKTASENRYDAQAHTRLKEELAALETRLQQEYSRKGQMEETLSRLSEFAAAKKELEKMLRDKQRHCEELQVLKLLFQKKGFVDFVASRYLRLICHSANERFHQLTRKQLQLELSEDNQFEVRDFLNDGRVRSVKTLSGGQKFQVAFSLALALTDHIRHLLSASQSFFFIDEGFGTLDKPSLHLVLDALQSLRRENRIVGVISHVEDMQQHTDVYLTVQNHPEKGSQVHYSWT